MTGTCLNGKQVDSGESEAHLEFGRDATTSLEAFRVELAQRHHGLFFALLFLVVVVAGMLPLVKLDVKIVGSGTVRYVSSAAAASPGPGEGALERYGTRIDGYVGEYYVKYLKAGQSVSIQFNAYPYRDWGTAHGEIVSVSNRPINIMGRPLYKVLVASDATEMSMGGSRAGRIDPDMTARLQFIVARKTLFRFIYEKSSDLLWPDS